MHISSPLWNADRQNIRWTYSSNNKSTISWLHRWESLSKDLDENVNEQSEWESRDQNICTSGISVYFAMNLWRDHVRGVKFQQLWVLQKYYLLVEKLSSDSSMRGFRDIYQEAVTTRTSTSSKYIPSEGTPLNVWPTHSSFLSSRIVRAGSYMLDTSYPSLRQRFPTSLGIETVTTNQ